MAATFDQLPNEVADLKELVRGLCKKVDHLISGKPDVKEIMNAEEAAAFLGVSKGTLYNNNSGLPYHKFGKKNYYKLEDLQEWKLKNRIKSKEEQYSDLQEEMISKQKTNRK